MARKERQKTRVEIPDRPTDFRNPFTDSSQLSFLTFFALPLRLRAFAVKIWLLGKH
jgi:hypothetical protein